MSCFCLRGEKLLFSPEIYYYNTMILQRHRIFVRETECKMLLQQYGDPPILQCYSIVPSELWCGEQLCPGLFLWNLTPFVLWPEPQIITQKICNKKVTLLESKDTCFLVPKSFKFLLSAIVFRAQLDPMLFWHSSASTRRYPQQPLAWLSAISDSPQLDSVLSPTALSQLVSVLSPTDLSLIQCYPWQPQLDSVFFMKALSLIQCYP